MHSATDSKNNPGTDPLQEVPYPSQMVIERNAWYQKMAKYLMYGLIGSMLLNIVQGFTNYWQATKPAEVLSYMMDENGHMVALQPLRNPSVTDTQVLNWSKDRVVDLHTFTFTGWRQELQRLSKFFIESAYENYITALTDSKTIKKIVKDKLLVTATPARAPVIIKKGEVNGIYMWTIEMPIIQTIEGGNTSPVNNTLTAHMVIQRVPRTDNLAGIKIRSYLVKEGIN